MLKLELVPRSPGESGALGWGPRIGIASDAEDAGQGAHLRKPHESEIGKGE